MQLDQPLLRHLHDGGDHVAKAAMLLILQADDIGHAGQNRKAARGQHLRGLQFFAAQADHHRSPAEIWIQTQIAQGTNGNFGSRGVDRDPASVGMGNRNHIVNVRITGQNL